jgi:hypothetical protein
MEFIGERHRFDPSSQQVPKEQNRYGHEDNEFPENVKSFLTVSTIVLPRIQGLERKGASQRFREKRVWF